MRKRMLTVFACMSMVFAMIMAVYANHSSYYTSEYEEYVAGQTVIEIEEDTRDFFKTIFSELASETDEKTVAYVENGAYTGMTYGEGENEIRGWCYCPADVIGDIFWQNLDVDLLEEDSYIYVSSEYSVNTQSLVNPFSEPECAYVAIRVNATMPERYKEWMTYTLVVRDVERNIYYSYELCNMFDGAKRFEILLPVGNYIATLFADGVDYGLKLPTNFTVSTDYVANGVIYLYEPTINEQDVTLVESELGETYDWLDSTEDEEPETEEESEVEEHHVNVTVKNKEESTESDTGSAEEQGNIVENTESEAETEGIEESEDSDGDSDDSGFLSNIKPARLFNYICIALLVLVIYYYFYYRPRKIRKKRRQGE